MALAQCPQPTFLHANQIDALYTVYSSSQIKSYFDSQALGIINYLNTTAYPVLSTTVQVSNGTPSNPVTNQIIIDTSL